MYVCAYVCVCIDLCVLMSVFFRIRRFTKDARITKTSLQLGRVIEYMEKNKMVKERNQQKKMQHNRGLLSQHVMCTGILSEIAEITTLLSC